MNNFKKKLIIILMNKRMNFEKFLIKFKNKFYHLNFTKNEIIF